MLDYVSRLVVTEGSSLARIDVLKDARVWRRSSRRIYNLHKLWSFQEGHLHGSHLIDNVVIYSVCEEVCILLKSRLSAFGSCIIHWRSDQEDKGGQSILIEIMQCVYRNNILIRTLNMPIKQSDNVARIFNW